VRDELREYYEHELTFLRRMGGEFAEKHPGIASRLLLEPNQCADPHVERMIEAFAFLAARVHLKVDDEFPEITEALLGILYPHYIRPIPSMTVVQFQPDPQQGKLTTGLPIPQGTVLYSRRVDDLQCKFRTCYDTTLWPVSVLEAEWVTPDRLEPPVKAADSVAALRVVLECHPEVSFNKLEMRSLQFYLDGESNLVHTLYELLCNNCARILARDATAKSKRPPIVLSRDALRPVGFAEEEAVLPYPRRSFIGYRLLQEYFTFPQKFFFLELKGFEQLSAAGFTDKAELVFLISRFEREDREVGVSAKTLRLGCVPVINLFSKTAEPILLDQTRSEYPVIPDVRRRHAMEIFSVDRVSCANPQSREVTYFKPLFSSPHAPAREKQQSFWHTTRRPSGRKDDEGTEVYLSLVDLSLRPVRPDSDSVTAHCTCTNRDLASRLPIPSGSESGDFEVERISSVKRIVALRKLTPTLRPPVGRGALWHLISHLSLNYLSLVDEGKDALQEILRLYNFSDSPHLEKQISGISDLKSKRHFARVISENGISFVRGTRVEMALDEDQFAGAGVYLFATVLEHFLGLYASMNSFSKLVVSTQQRKETLQEWPPRAGQSILM
jgi:type VI secretion system protein ImpG